MTQGTMHDYYEEARKGCTVYFKDGKCSGCGECCSNYLPISSKEIKEIHRYVKKHKIKECKHALSPLVNQEILDFVCPFLDMSKPADKCTIYQVRPFICRSYTCQKFKDGNMDDRAKMLRQKMIPVDMREEFFGE